MSSGSRGESPKTPNGRLGPGRSDDYFSPRIATDSPPGQSRRPGGYGGFAEPDAYDAEPVYPGASPKPATNLLQRMNTIAPGPFEAGRRPSGRFQTRNAPEEYDRPGTAMSNLSSSVGSMRGAPRAPRKNGYGGFGPPSRGEDELEPQPFGMAQRSDTFPRPSDPIDTPARTPSAPGPRPSWRRPSNETAKPMPMTDAGMRRPSKDTSRPPPPRTSLVRSKTSASSSSTGSVNVAAEFGIGNPYHTPSDSMSSSVSGYSQPSGRPSQSSSQSSLSRSAGSSFDRKPSDAAGLDSVMGSLRPPMDDRRPKELPQSPMQPPPIDKAKPFSKTLAKRPPPPPQGYDPRIDPRPRRALSPLASPAMELASPTVDMYARDDPAIQGPRRNRSPEPRVTPQNPGPSSPERPMTRSRSRPRSPARQSPSQDPAAQSRSRSRPRDPAVQSRSRSRPREPAVQARSRSRPREQPPLPSARGDCKSCRLPITGKSISSADGRLTGRYHKACFVCTTCKEPFSSATFYVLDDKPYCDRHYHELNGSLCGGCGNGIEGQYLEDESTKKHHPGCFRCGDCGVVLRDGYFEVGGRAYCEKDAWRRVQQPWMTGGGGRKGSTPSASSPLGLPAGPGGPRAGSFGLPSNNRMMGPGSFVPRPRMEKRMTRLGMM